MILDTGNKRLKFVRAIWRNDVNSICIYEEIGTVKSYYTVWEINERTLAKSLLECGQYECFTYKNRICFLFPYEEQRCLEKYYLSVISENPMLREKILRECVITCMSGGVAYPLLYLMITQGQINVEKDGSIHLGYELNLEEYSSDIGEAECATACARLLLNLLRMDDRNNIIGISLLERKLQKEGYASFKELFRDVQLVTERKQKKSVKNNLKKTAMSKRDSFFRFLLVVSCILVFVVIIMLLMNLFFGDVSFYQLFQNSLEQIGTESLVQ